ncbi:pimeloyl-ACP methyl ester carboxylesterase [Bradyrhizobium japonicum]|uniref:epoxide hydrolase family protein n=1 Tax=Bradyrhizobium TaxID=374 RepID=UPI000401E38B|nr:MULTISPECIES: epoxide hydrolase [Bradyrhizobium]MBR0880511.1 alpha/beta fold hydrolase [Bradyrhizobium liaoningense]MBR0999586.1 alpha/beta fold hydrolase [Bradyrhizobium liaoningense]MBR1065199.1 alpha/beta fold hydrolase [Bradyrhizobium liaoningense]
MPTSALPSDAGSPAARDPDARQALVLPPAPDSLAPFEVHVPQGAIDDLRLRLGLVRWPDRETVRDWSQGVPLSAAKSLIDCWLHDYDWRKFEARLNRFAQFRTRIDGVGIHFIHARSPHPNALPIVLTHGWPGSVAEFLDVIDRLTDPTRFGGRAEDAFHVVVPSIPGYGFSDKPTEPGWNPGRIARAWAALMHERLGYERWVAQGGDWGSAITHAMASQRPQGLLAAHVNLPLVVPKSAPEHPTKDEQRALENIEHYLNQMAGYADQMNTRPQTIGYALSDSPLALAMWMYEKFWEWTDNRGLPEDALTRDQMLDDISLYWFTGTGASSARLYWEGVGSTIRENSFFSNSRASSDPIDLPMAATIFPGETFLAPRSWAEASWSKLFYWNEVDKGGHFAAFEQPEIFAREMWRAFATFRG